MAITLNDNVQVNAPKGIDAKYMKFTGGLYQPYASAAEANSIISSFYRYQFLTVMCLMNSDAVEYWYQGGILDANLVPKHKESYNISTSTGIALTNGYTYGKIIVIPTALIANLIIGTTNGGNEIEFGSPAPANTAFTVNIALYAATSVLYFGGISGIGTKIILYKDY